MDSKTLINKHYNFNLNEFLSFVDTTKDMTKVFSETLSTPLWNHIGLFAPPDNFKEQLLPEINDFF